MYSTPIDRVVAALLCNCDSTPAVDQECRMLREHLHVQLTRVAHIEVQVSAAGPSDAEPKDSDAK
jgi:hypothetical protein